MDACMQFNVIRTIYSLSMHQLLNGQLAKLSAILDSFLLV